MADKISAFTSAGALTGVELVPIVQSGVTVKTTTQDIANLSISSVSSGIWSPSVLDILNIDTIGIIANSFHYIKTGTEVIFNGIISPTTLGSGASEISITLPIASDFTNVINLVGIGTSVNIGFTGIYLEGHVATNTIRLKFNTTGAITSNIYFSAMYTII